MNTGVMFSSNTNDWSTPQYFFDQLNTEFNFTLDPCATYFNTKCEKWYGYEFGENEYDEEFVDGLKFSWMNETVFCNPPYGRAIKEWVKKGYEESRKPNTTVVMLLPARTDTSYFHKYIYHKAREIRFVPGRLKFGNAQYNAPFPCMVVVF